MSDKSDDSKYTVLWVSSTDKPAQKQVQVETGTQRDPNVNANYVVTTVSSAGNRPRTIEPGPSQSHITYNQIITQPYLQTESQEEKRVSFQSANPTARPAATSIIVADSTIPLKNDGSVTMSVQNPPHVQQTRQIIEPTSRQVVLTHNVVQTRLATPSQPQSVQQMVISNGTAKHVQERQSDGMNVLSEQLQNVSLSPRPMQIPVQPTAYNQKEDCFRCRKKVYSTEKVGPMRDVIYHKQCFRCMVCGSLLTISSVCHNPNNFADCQVYCRSHQPATGSSKGNISDKNIQSALNKPKLDTYNQTVRGDAYAAFDTKAVFIKGAMNVPKLDNYNPTVRVAPVPGQADTIDINAVNIKGPMNAPKLEKYNPTVRLDPKTGYKLDMDAVAIKSAVNVPKVPSYNHEIRGVRDEKDNVPYRTGFPAVLRQVQPYPYSDIPPLRDPNEAGVAHYASGNENIVYPAPDYDLYDPQYNVQHFLNATPNSTAQYTANVPSNAYTTTIPQVDGNQYINTTQYNYGFTLPDSLTYQTGAQYGGVPVQNRQPPLTTQQFGNVQTQTSVQFDTDNTRYYYYNDGKR